MKRKPEGDFPLALLVSGIIACIALFIFQATPIFLHGLGWMFPLYAVFSTTLFLLVFIVTICLFFAFMVEELYDRHDLHTTKSRYRRIKLMHYRKRLMLEQRRPSQEQAMQTLPRPTRKHQALIHAYLHVLTHFPFKKQDRGHDKSI